MDKIKPVARYARGYYYGMGGEVGPTMDQRDDGDWVRYTDHSAAIDALRAEVERLQGLLKSAPVVRIGGADGLSCFIEKFGKNSLPSMQGQSVSLVSVDAMKVGAP